MNACHCSACLAALAAAVVAQSLEHPFDDPHAHNPVPGEHAPVRIQGAALASSSSSAVSVMPGTAELIVTGFPPTVRVFRLH